MAYTNLPNGLLAGELRIGTVDANIQLPSGFQSLTASAAVTPGIQALELNHATVVIAATIATTLPYAGTFLVVKDTSASGTAAHTVTITTGTWDGTNKIATLNAPNEAFEVFFDSVGNGTIVSNVGSVAFS